MTRALLFPEGLGLRGQVPNASWPPRCASRPGCGFLLPTGNAHDALTGNLRFANLPNRLADQGLSVDASVIGNERDWVNGGAIPGVPYYSLKDGKEERGETFFVGGLVNARKLMDLHGRVMKNPRVLQFIRDGSW